VKETEVIKQDRLNHVSLHVHVVLITIRCSCVVYVTGMQTKELVYWVY